MAKEQIHSYVANQCLPPIMMFVETVAKVMDLFLDSKYEFKSGRPRVKIYNDKLCTYPLFFDKNYSAASTLMGMKYLYSDFVKILKRWDNRLRDKCIGNGDIMDFRKLVEVVYFDILNVGEKL